MVICIFASCLFFLEKMKYKIIILLILITNTLNNTCNCSLPKETKEPNIILPPTTDIILPPIMEIISKKESGGNWKAVNYNKNGTVDLGKYQLNSIAFKELNKFYGFPVPNKEKFLSDTLMQKKYALKLYEHNIMILKRRGKKINTKNVLKSWAVSAYNV